MNNLPDFMKYKDTFSTNGFVEKISRIAKRAGVKLVYAALLLYYTLENDKVSIKDKAIIIGALGYLISPLDLAVLIYVLHKVWGDVSEEVKNKARAKLSMWFDTDEINVTDDIFKDTPDNAPV